MEAKARPDAVAPIATPRALCLLVADRPAPAALIQVTGAGATIETPLRPEIGSRATLRHPEAGTIAVEIVAHERRGLRLRFDTGEGSVGFALAAIASEIAARR